MHTVLPPREDLDWEHLGVAGPDVFGHVESRYNVETGVWSCPEVKQDPYLRVHGLAPGLNYGQQCYEGLKAFRTTPTAVSIFRPQRHGSRMAHSASCVSIPPIPEEHFVRCVELAVLANSAYVPPHTSRAMLYIRPLAFGSSDMLGLAPPSEFTFCVFVKPLTAYHGTQPLDALVMEDFDRSAPRGTGNAKVGGNYAPVMRWQAAAKAEGYGITLHLDSTTRSEIDEFSTSGFMGVKADDNGNVKVVVPDSTSIIDSVTSDSCLTLARSLGWTVEKRPIKYDEISSFSEVFAVGTAACLVPVRSITRKSTGDKFSFAAAESGPGPACEALSAKLDRIMRGQEPDPFGWRHVVGAAAKPAAPANGVLLKGQDVIDSVMASSIQDEPTSRSVVS